VTNALELRRLSKRYDDGLLALDAEADSLADVYVKAMAGVEIRSPS
jgi:hypothetical protein